MSGWGCVPLKLYLEVGLAKGCRLLTSDLDDQRHLYLCLDLLFGKKKKKRFISVFQMVLCSPLVFNGIVLESVEVMK